MTQETFNAAQEHHRAGRFPEAQTNYRAVLAEEPNHAAAMHFLGLVEFQVGHNGAAIDLMERAMRIESGRADFFCNYGLVLANSGRVDEAIRNFRRALELNPDYAEAHNNLGIALASMGQKEQAIEEYRAAIKLKANNPEAYNNMGSALQSLNRFDEAIAAFEQAMQLRSNFSEAQNNLGNALMDAGRHEDAFEAYRRALAMPRKLPQSYYGLGNALRKLDRLDEAIGAFGQAIAMRADYGEAYTNLGEALLTAGRIEQAVSALAKATELTPANYVVLYNYACALMQDGKYEPAKVMLHRALELKPDYPEALSNLGNTLLSQGDVTEALATYDKLLAANPDFALGHWNRALALFLTGDWKTAWQEYEWRSKIPSFKLKRPTPPEKQWDGSELNGRRILLYAEQGYGDAIQFFRYAPLVALRGGKVVVQAPAHLVRLFQQTPEVQVVSAEEPAPEFDLHYPLMSLPLLFGTSRDSIPTPTRYVTADPELIGSWGQKMPNDPKVLRIGLVWRGRPTPDAQRSIPSDLLAPLGGLARVWFINLQVGQSGTTPPFPVTDWRSDMKDFADTAAIMVNLDLVLTIDSASAHLAGALGCRTWTMLKYIPDWRWLREGTDASFYPTMRLFRQKTPGDWTGVIEEVVRELRPLIEQRNPTDPNC